MPKGIPQQIEQGFDFNGESDLDLVRETKRKKKTEQDPQSIIS